MRNDKNTARKVLILLYFWICFMKATLSMAGAIFRHILLIFAVSPFFNFSLSPFEAVLGSNDSLSPTLRVPYVIAPNRPKDESPSS